MKRFISRNGGYLKLTSGATLLAVAPTLALQAQGKVDVTNSATSAFRKLSNVGLDGNSVKAFKYLAYTVILASSVFLLYCLACFIDNKAALKILEGKLKSELSSATEKINSVEKILLSIKSGLKDLHPAVQTIQKKVAADDNEYKASPKRISTELKEYSECINLMKEVKIWNDFEKDYFKVKEKLDDFGFIKKLEELCKKLDEKLEEVQKTSTGESLRYQDVEVELLRLTGDGSLYLHPRKEQVDGEISTRAAIEKEKNPDVYKAYLRYKFASSFLSLLKAKKEMIDAKAELEKYKDVNIGVELKKIQEKIKNFKDEINRLNSENGPLGEGALQAAWSGGEKEYSKFLKHLDEINRLRVGGDCNYSTDLSEGLEGASSSLASTIKDFKKTKIMNNMNKRNALEKELENNQKNKSFFHIPGKYIRESLNYEF